MSRNSAGSASQYAFSMVPDAFVPRTKLRRPSTHKTTIDAGKLYPLFYDEVLPGDTFKLDVSCLARMTTMLAPIMDNLYLDWQFFFVPNRLVWSKWQAMMGEKDNPTDTTEYTVPYMVPSVSGTVTTITEGSFFDYLGLPIGLTPRPHQVSALPMRAYQLIWNEWYRNENIDACIEYHDLQNDELFQAYLLPRMKRKDYFTGALPEPQKGSPLTIPIGATAPVMGTGAPMYLSDGTVSYSVAANRVGDSDFYNKVMTSTSTPSALGATVVNSPLTSGDALKSLGFSSSHQVGVADLTSATSVTINELRQAFQLQKLLERDARGGTRYVEILRSHFNVISPDARLQRPEFLGSFSIPINVHTIAQTSASAGDGTPQGNLAGVGVASGVKRAFTKSFVEHGMIFGLASIRSDQSYWQGVPRTFSRASRFDFFWPALAHIGEQAILKQEIYAQGTDVDDEVFGYQERWSEYKYGRNIISGKLRPLDGWLGEWHLAQRFGDVPTLNSTFLREYPPISRVTAVSDEPAFIVDTAFDLTCIRPMPVYDVPGFVDHF